MSVSTKEFKLIIDFRANCCEKEHLTMKTKKKNQCLDAKLEEEFVNEDTANIFNSDKSNLFKKNYRQKYLFHNSFSSQHNLSKPE